MEPTTYDDAPVLGLALGGGGMKGLAHVGALSVLERAGLRPDVIAGCSIGAIIGALYAAGFDAGALARLLREQSLLKLFTFRLDGQGLLSVSALRTFLKEHLGDRRFEDLAIPLRLNATDLETGEEVVLHRGPVVEAVLASSAIPGLFAPVSLGGRRLVDGGLSNNLPVSLLSAQGTRYVIGVRLFWQSTTWEIDDTGEKPGPALPPEAIDDDGPRPGWTERLAGRMLNHMPPAFATVQRSLDLVVIQNETARLRDDPPDVLITPEVTDIGILDFHEDKALIFNRGVEAAEREMPALRRLAAAVENERARAREQPAPAPRTPV